LAELCFFYGAADEQQYLLYGIALKEDCLPAQEVFFMRGG